MAKHAAGRCLSHAQLLGVGFLASGLALGCGDSDDHGLTDGVGATADAGADASSEADGDATTEADPSGCTSDEECNDGEPCTADACRGGVCTNALDVSLSSDACGASAYCSTEGCTPRPICAEDADCAEAFADDNCKATPTCDPASSLCEFSLLDKDSDGHAPIVCGGDDCDDSGEGGFPGAVELCDGRDDDCDGTVDESAICENPLEYCESPGNCECRPENACSGGCVDTQTDSAHCGACGATCTGGQCEQGECVCPDDLTACDGECLNVAWDPANCGSCGNACPSALCLFAECATPAVELASIAGRGMAIATSVDHVWVIVDGEEVHRVAKAGSSTDLMATLTSYNPLRNRAIATDDAHAYWACGLEMQRVPLLGGVVETLLTKEEEGAQWIGFHDASVLWFDGAVSSNLSIVYEAPKAGGAKGWLLTAGDGKRITALDQHNSLLAIGWVQNYSTYGAKTTDFVTTESMSCTSYENKRIEAIASNGDDVWWISDEMLRHWNMFGGSEDFAKLPGYATNLELAGGDLVWRSISSDSGLIGKTSIATRVSTALAVTSNGLDEALTVDGGYVYWTKNESNDVKVMKIAVSP